MTIVTIGRTATLLPATPLPVKGGSIRLDDSGWPYGTSTLRLRAGDASLRAALDPRTQPRVRIIGTRDVGGQSRTFEFDVRELNTTAVNGEWILTLATGEAALSDYSTTSWAGGGTPGSDATIRACMAGFASGFPGGLTIQASPAWDAPMNISCDAENLVADPRMVTATYDVVRCTGARSRSWPGTQDGVALNSWRLSAPTGADSYLKFSPNETTMNGFAVGETWVVSADVNCEAAQGGPDPLRARSIVAFAFMGGSTYLQFQSPPGCAATAGSEGRAKLRFTVPEGAQAVFIRAYHGGTSGTIRWGKFRVAKEPLSALATRDPEMRPDQFFCGSTAAVPGRYSYSWQGTPDASTSLRKALSGVTPEAAWREPGESAFGRIAALLQSRGWRFVCDEAGLWTIRADTDTRPGTLTLSDTTSLIELNDVTSRDDEEWFDAARCKYQWTDTSGIVRTAIEVYVARDEFGDPVPITKVKDIDVPSAFPGQGRAKAAVERAARRGQRLTTTSLIDWAATPGQAASSGTWTTTPCAPKS